jgi:hypothetical protein
MKTLSWMGRTAVATACLAVTVVTSQLPAYALDATGDAPQASGTTLVLNGAGARLGTTTYLYSARLYLEHKTTDPHAILQNLDTTQFRMTMLQDASTKDIFELISQGIVANASDDDLMTLVSEIFDVGVMLSEQGKLLAGDSIEIDSHPAAGTTLTIRSRSQNAPITQTFANPRLFKVMLGIWLGDRPADPALKQALLGQPI